MADPADPGPGFGGRSASAPSSTSASASGHTLGCRLCPRLCNADRCHGQRGSCGADDSLRVARAALHFWEEPPISGTRGSGTVFFSNCALRCSYCQNAPISQGLAGKPISVARLTEIFLELQAKGAHNINLVTPTHYVDQIIEAVQVARTGQAARTGRAAKAGQSTRAVAHTGQATNDASTTGTTGTTRTARNTVSTHAAPATPLTIPVVYNTSGYELPATINRLASTVDVYLTDFKYASPALAARYSNAPDYPTAALAALEAMVAQRGRYLLDAQGILQEGVIVRHLLLPGQLADSLEVLRRVFASVGNQVCYALMNQFTPLPGAPPELQRPVADADYDALIDFALDLGITNSFMQEGGTSSASFIPPFDLEGV